MTGVKVKYVQSCTSPGDSCCPGLASIRNSRPDQYWWHCIHARGESKYSRGGQLNSRYVPLGEAVPELHEELGGVWSQSQQRGHVREQLFQELVCAVALQ